MLTTEPQITQSQPKQEQEAAEEVEEEVGTKEEQVENGTDIEEEAKQKA